MPARGIGGLTKKLEKAEAKGDTNAVNKILADMREKAPLHTIDMGSIVLSSKTSDIIRRRSHSQRLETL